MDEAEYVCLGLQFCLFFLKSQTKEEAFSFIIAIILL